jgi:hypothetical protein
MSEKLKPCPFCGGETQLIMNEDHHGVHYELGCPKRLCPAYWVYYTQPEKELPNIDAVKEWNNRPIEDALEHRVKVLELALENINNNMSFNCGDCPVECDSESHERCVDAFIEQAEKDLEG